MKRCFAVAWMGLLLAALVMGQAVAQAVAQSPEEKKATLAWLHSLQRENGGFAADVKAESPTLPATSSALRAIKYFGGEAKSKDRCYQFIQECFDATAGGFAPTPGGKPDVRTTAVGLMAVRQFEPPGSKGSFKYMPGMVFMIKNANTFEEIRMAAAGAEGFQTPITNAEGFVAEVNKQRNPDGSYGKGARDTASGAVTILRLGAKLDNPQRVLQVLKTGQLTDGGWGKEDEKSDLETTYRVLRAFHMLKEKPNVEACRKFVASCRNADGSYSVQPGQPGNVGATYFAGIVLHWLDGMK